MLKILPVLKELPFALRSARSSAMATAFCLAIAASCSISAGEADVIDLTITKTSNGQFTISATLNHGDTGWDHYADRWDVVAPDGTVLGSRILHHPHENEMPFTRSLTLAIPANIAEVTIRANDSVHELGGKAMQLQVPH